MLESLFDIANRFDFHTNEIQGRLAESHRYLGELKGACLSIPNQEILISTLTLQESEQSSAIESIFTTQDALYKAKLNPETADSASKEVSRYADALLTGNQTVQRENSIVVDTVLQIQADIPSDSPNFQAGFRDDSRKKVAVINELTGDVIYRPPKSQNIRKLMKEWEEFANDDSRSRLDPLVKMALLHHQFETIHPFEDGNGRTGRILNILYLVKNDLLHSPILYLSRYINQTKRDYYRLLQEVRTHGKWDEWVVYMLEGVYQISRNTLWLINEIRSLLQEAKQAIREQHLKIYSQDLLNNLFTHPYTKAKFLADDIGVSNNTAARYLQVLADDGILSQHKLGRENYYINTKLTALLFNIPAP